MSNWRAAARMALGGAGRFPEVSKTITSENLSAETRMNTGVGFAPEVSEVYAVFNPPLHIKSFSEKLLLIVENSMEMGNHRGADLGGLNMAPAKTPHKPHKPSKPVNEVSAVSAVNGSASVPRSIVVAVRTGDPAKIAAAVQADPDLSERSAIRQYDGGMCRLDADLATLLDVIDEAGYVI